MSILITNDGSNPRADGEHGYVVRINHDVIATFKHTREEGLAACLRRAAEAVELAEISLASAKASQYLANYANHQTRITKTCGGCGETDPRKQCMGCRHQF